MKPVNLIPTPRLDERHRKQRVRRWISACSAYSVMLLAAYCIIHATLGHAGQDLKDELSIVSNDIRVTQAKITAISPQVQEASLTLTASTAVGSQPDWSILLALLADELGNRVVLSTVRLEPTTDLSKTQPTVSAVANRYTLHLQGVGQSQALVSQYVLKLEASKLFDRIKLIDSNRGPFGAGEAVSFRLTCEFGSR
jgi:hypothetical protein